MPHTPEWHAIQAERLLEQAENLLDEGMLDLKWPSHKEKYDVLMARVMAHAKLAEVLPKPQPRFTMWHEWDDEERQ